MVLTGWTRRGWDGDGISALSDHGDEAYCRFLYHFSQLECWAGKLGIARRSTLGRLPVVEERPSGTMKPDPLYSLGPRPAHRGQVDDCSRVGG